MTVFVGLCKLIRIDNFHICLRGNETKELRLGMILCPCRRVLKMLAAQKVVDQRKICLSIDDLNPWHVLTCVDPKPYRATFFQVKGLALYPGAKTARLEEAYSIAP